MLVAPPDVFEGTISAFIDQYVVPNFPSAARLISWTDALLAYYLDDPDPACVVRDHRHFRGTLRRQDQLRAITSDNSTAIWAYLRCHDGGIDAFDIKSRFDAGAVPVLLAARSAEKATWTYGSDLKSHDAKMLWGRGLKHCHIWNAWPRAAMCNSRQLALRNVCPLKHFLFPSPKKFSMSVRSLNGGLLIVDLGESEDVIAWVKNRLAAHLGDKRTIFDRFAHVVGETLPGHSPVDATVTISRKEASPVFYRPADESTTEPSQHVTSGSMNHWTLNAAHGYYVRNGITQTSISVALSCKATDGSVSPVGVFHLNLSSLGRAGVVKVREVEGRKIFDVRIVKETDGSFVLAGRHGMRQRLT